MERPDAKGQAIAKRVATGAKKMIIAKKMGGSVIGRPADWKKVIEPRNLENELTSASFTKGDEKKINKANKQTANGNVNQGGGWIN